MANYFTKFYRLFQTFVSPEWGTSYHVVGWRTKWSIGMDFYGNSGIIVLSEILIFKNGSD